MKCFFILLFLVSTNCYAQKKLLQVMDPMVMVALHKWADSLKQTISALRHDNINEAVVITCNELEEENKLSPDLLQKFNEYVKMFIDYSLRVKMFEYYLKTGGKLNMSLIDVYSIAFTDLLCRNAWCKLHTRAIEKYNSWYEIMSKYEENQALDAVVNESKSSL